MRPVLALLLLLVSARAACAGTEIFFKIAINDDSYQSFVVSDYAMRHSKLHLLATRMRQRFFDPASLSREFYQVTIREGFTLLGRDVRQYDLSPVLKDRFRHVLWVTTDTNLIVRREVYDLSDKLIFTYGYVHDLPAYADNTPVSSPESRGGDVYKGFAQIEEKETEAGTDHQLFSDGLNKFSVFLRPRTAEADILEKKIVYGNYVLRGAKGSTEYTVVGTIPFAEMEVWVNRLAGSLSEQDNMTENLQRIREKNSKEERE